MHFEILVEDQSGGKALTTLVPQIISRQDTFRVHPYKGIGRVPKNIKDTKNAEHRILLENLPKLLKGYGKAFKCYPQNYPAVVILVCDLDNKCLKAFRKELLKILDSCKPKPKTEFCFAIEEGEAWLLGDLEAIKTAYPKVKDSVLSAYVNDSICGTWEKLADAIFPGGSQQLIRKGWQTIGAEKYKWATEIPPYMDVNINASKSFCDFRDKLISLSEK